MKRKKKFTLIFKGNLSHCLGLENFKGLSRWYLDIAKRPAVVKGFKVLNKDNEIDYP